MYPVEGAWQNGQNFGTGRMSKGDAQLQNVLKKKKYKYIFQSACMIL